MSVLTSVLKLFKYDPVADKKSTYNITQALNDNWDKIDAKAAEVDEALAGKPDNDFGGINDLDTAVYPGTGYYLDSTGIVGQPGVLYNLTVKRTMYLGTQPSLSQRLVSTYLAGQPFLVCERSYYPATGGWSEWVKIATATPPDPSDLPLASGMAEMSGLSYMRYSKDQTDTVRIWCNLFCASGDGIANHQTLATLPEGCRPAGTHLFDISCWTASGERENANIILTNSGNLELSQNFNDVGVNHVAFFYEYTANK